MRVPAHPRLLATEAGYLARRLDLAALRGLEPGVPDGALVGDARHDVRVRPPTVSCAAASAAPTASAGTASRRSSSRTSAW